MPDFNRIKQKNGFPALFSMDFSFPLW